MAELRALLPLLEMSDICEMGVIAPYRGLSRDFDMLGKLRAKRTMILCLVALHHEGIRKADKRKYKIKRAIF